MYIICLYLLLISKSVHAFVVGKPIVNYFRDDYHFVEKTQSFYKIHKTALTWSEALNMCRSENAELFYARDKDEFEAVSEYRKTLKDQVKSDYVLIGISANFIPGVFDTIDGIPLSNVYYKWNENEPNNAGGKEHGIELNMVKGTMNDFPLTDKRLFICKRTLASLNWNNCYYPVSVDESTGPNTTQAGSVPIDSSINNENPRQCCKEGYTYNEDNGSCYKFVFNPKTWTEAYEYCRMEHSYLAIINNPLEVSFLTAIVKNASKVRIPDIYTPGSVHLGFYKRTNESWVTLKGKPIEASGYTHFGYDSKHFDENIRCGAMFYNRELRDVSCNEKCLFICEHES